MEFRHSSVMLFEAVDGLNIRPEGTYLDGTLGGGGHSEQILLRLSDKGHLYGIDKDEDAIRAASERLSIFGDRFTAIRGDYGDYEELLRPYGAGQLDGILLDLGVSSFQLDTAERGFSYRFDAPLDMRMDRRQEKTVRDIVNTYSEEELASVLFRYGEEPYAKNIARAIVRAREKEPVETTLELSAIISQAVPAKVRSKSGHPAKQSFQALRIEVNGELETLKNTLSGMIDRLAPKGRLAVISFHSLEDRIVKQTMRDAENPCICPPDFPVCVCGRKPKGKTVGRKPVVPSAQELEDNPRAKSAKLRIFEHI